MRKPARILDGYIANKMDVVCNDFATAGSTAATYDAATNKLNVVLEEGLNAAILRRPWGHGGCGPSQIDVSGTGAVASGDAGTYSDSAASPEHDYEYYLRTGEVVSGVVTTFNTAATLPFFSPAAKTAGWTSRCRRRGRNPRWC